MSDLCNCWFQRANFSGPEYPDITYNKASAVFLKIDWADELAFEEKLEKDSEDNCPPGFGIVRSNDEILHIMPRSNSTFDCALHFNDVTSSGKVRRNDILAKDVPDNLRLKFMRMAFEDKIQEIKSELKPYYLEAETFVDHRYNRNVDMLKMVKGIILPMFFILPFLVVVLYYIFDWQVAVLAFPVLLTLNVMMWPKKPRKKTLLRFVIKSLARVIAFGIPLLSVVYNDPNIMRFWALCVGIWFGWVFMREPKILAGYPIKENYRKISSVLFGVAHAILFVLLSELIWHFANLSLWIWYHAFFVIILIAIMIPSIVLIYYIAPKEEEEHVRVEEKPPYVKGASGEKHKLHIQWADKSFLVYNMVYKEQAQVIFEGVDWVKAEKKGVDNKIKHPVFVLDIGGAEKCYFEIVSDINANFNWSTKGEKKWYHLFALSAYHKAIDIPIEWAPEVLELIWNEDWAKIENKLQSYIQTEAE